MVDRQVLDSWKEIAAYLGRSVRTCQRLERDLDLPVHRLEETPKARVFAYQDEINLWINRSKNSESEARSKLFGLKKILIPASAALFLIIMAVVIWKFLPQKETGTAVIPAPKTSVAVVYFKNNTGDENLEHWRRALCELLIYDLAQSRYIDILPADKQFDVMNQLGLADTSEYSAEELEQIADNAKIKNIIHGNFVKAGNKFRISASIRDFEEGRDVLLESSEGEGEESLFAVVDELTAKIKHELEFSSEQVAADVDRNVENITTSSPEALKYYSAGWNHRFRGNNIEAIRLMEKAIEIDPQFALAYRVLGTLYTSVGKPYLSNEYRIKAYELRDRVSDRERLLLEVLHLTSSESTRGRAIEAAKEFLEFYPDSDHPNNLLGAICWDTGKWKESLGYHESAFRISAHSVTWANLITACQASGYNKRAEKIYKDYQTIYSNNFRNAHLWMPEYHYLLMGEYDIAKSEAQKIFLIDPSFPSLPLFRADTFHLAGDLAGAEGEYQLLLNSVEVGPLERESRKRLSSLYLLQGKFGAARDVLKETAEREVLQAASLRKQIMNLSNLMAHTYLVTGDIEKAHEVLDFLMEDSALDPDPIFFRRLVLWGKGKIYRELHLIDELRGVADTLSQTENPFMSVMGRWYIHHINGLLSLEEGDTSEAIDQFKKVVALLPSQNINFGYNQHAIFLDSLAFAYFKAGDLERARTEYERITALTMGRLYFGDIYAESFYMLGKIYEQQGKKAKATQNYEKFLDFRKGADPGIAEVEDARQRLAGLR